MVDLLPIGPSSILRAYGAFTLEVFYCNTTSGKEGCNSVGLPIRAQWDVCGEDDDEEPKEYAQTICDRGRRKLEITYLVIPNAIEANVKVRLKLNNLGSRSHAVYGKIKASAADYGNRSVHLFSCARGRSWSVPSCSSSILPLSPSVIALPCRRQFELYLEVDLVVVSTSDNQEEEEKNLKFTSLKFTHRVTSQEREVDGDQVEVNITWNPIFS
ncbi:unnamed protein product [Urochloa decumbens]|uniref:DUF6598 domain-containing protein n=1 Tax=Urochloa decumbens TaxID=240449 RepID=A0ABC8WX48_9POAL